MNDTAERLTSILRRHPEIELAILFGSMARKGGSSQSDIDLAVDFGRPSTAMERMALIEEIAGEFGQPVDLVDLACAGEPLLGQIIKGGRQLIGDSDRFARLLSRHWIDQADFQPLRDRILTRRRSDWIGN